MSLLPLELTVNKFAKQHISRLPPSADALYIAQLHTNWQQPLLIISNEANGAKRLALEIQLFAPQLKIAIFSDTETIAYDRISPPKEIIAERLRVLWQITLKQLDIVIIQANTLQTCICPKEYLYQRVLILNVGNKLSLTSLRNKLISSDYSLVEQVYEPSEFAIRGGIVDIMPMGSKKLVRLELFDDEIESLKILDYKTKQLIEEVKSFELIPAREYPTDQAGIKNFITNVNNYFQKPEDLAFFRDAAKGILPPGCEFYLPLFFTQTATIFDYLDDNWQIIYSQTTHAQLVSNWQEITKRYEHFSTQYPCLKPDELFVPVDNIFAQLKRFKTFELATTGETYPGITLLPDLTIENKAANPLIKLAEFIQKFKGAVVLIVDSLGRLEIMRQTLESYHFRLTIIHQLEDIATTNSQIYLIQAVLYNGFICNNVAFITEQDLYRLSPHNLVIRRKKAQATHIDNDAIIRDLAEIKVGDYVVHINHGIGRYRGLIIQTIADIEYEMLELEYQNEAKLFIPVHNLHLISRYSKLDDINVQISKLGSAQWDKVKTKAEKRIEDLAAALLELYAKRKLEQGNKFNLPEEYDNFVNSFGYDATADQETCFASIIEDMTSQKPMDRLICGDVGFGKTEVAFRAAFIAAMNSKQVAVLTPTTLLTEQHYQNFVNRFAGFPIRIAEVSRFKTKKEVSETLELVKTGKIDILIGTHRLLQSDISFADLGLVVIDEEHRFGVKQKEALKKLRANVDFLAMTATPIPRSLSMALDGLRDFSIIATPPKRRLAINTLIIQDESHILREAILREVRRGGQVFFLYNDVATISLMYDKLSKLMPELQIAIAHGQMNEHMLEQTIRDFIKQHYNILLCSTIIETGIDIANANTIIIYRADKFGLAQLHQLRGRVGRSHHQAYCYLIVPEVLTSDAEKRLDAISSTAELGAGFNLALHDLEIRGAGEILGDNQSGDIKEVGLSLYTEMLKKAIARIKNTENLALGEPNAADLYCDVNLNTSSILPDYYCPDIHERLIYYKRLAKASNNDEIDLVYQDIMDNWGLPPDELKNLINSHYLRVKALQFGIQKLDATNTQISFTFIDKPPIDPLKFVLLLQELKTCKYNGKNKLIWSVTSANIQDKIKHITSVLNHLLT